MEASLSEQAAADIELRVELHAPELASINVRNPVMHGQTLIHEGIVRC